MRCHRGMWQRDKSYDIVLDIEGREHRIRDVPVEWPIEMLLAKAFPGIPVRNIKS